MRRLRHPLLEVSALCSFICMTAVCQNGPIQPASTVSKEVIQGFQRIENTWSQAIDNRDQYALELMLAPDFLNIGIDGEITTRNLQIAQLLQKHRTTPPSIRQRVVNVRDYGDITIVVGTFVQESRDGKQTVEHAGVFMHVYQQVRGKWQCISAHWTALQPAPETRNRRSKKQDDIHPFDLRMPQADNGPPPVPQLK
jgi:ketosteroid isomerase-like protein